VGPFIQPGTNDRLGERKKKPKEAQPTEKKGKGDWGGTLRKPARREKKPGGHSVQGGGEKKALREKKRGKTRPYPFVRNCSNGGKGMGIRSQAKEKKT